MFREMRRYKQQIAQEECIQILKEQLRGVLSVLGDDNYPYGIPLSSLVLRGKRQTILSLRENRPQAGRCSEAR